MYYNLFEHLFYKEKTSMPDMYYLRLIMHKFSSWEWNIFKINDQKLNKQIYGKMNIHKAIEKAIKN